MTPPDSAATVVPLTRDVHRQLLIDAARDLLANEPWGPRMQPIADRLAALGVDLTDPAQMIAIAMLCDSLNYGLEPSPRALARLMGGTA